MSQGDPHTQRTIVLTGASSGIGAEAAALLADAGDRIAVVGRNEERTRLIAARVGGDPFIADFDRLEEVRSLAERLLSAYPRIDVLANNAGGLVSTRETTVDGNERTIQSNHFASFLLTGLLMPRLLETAREGRDVRVVSTASMAHRFADLRLDDLDWRARRYGSGLRVYGTAKLATILFIRELAERLVGTGIRAYSFHPGVVATSFGQSSSMIRLANAVTGGRYGIPAAEGALPLVSLAGREPVRAPSGTYFDRLTANGRVSAAARDPQLARDLWAATVDAVGLDPVTGS